MSEYTIKDSGKRQQFTTGSVRDLNVDKGDFSLLPCRAIALLAKHFQAGCKKYGAANWKRGQPLSRYVDSGLRHAFKHLNGDTDERHDIAAAWNFMCLIETRQMIEDGLLPKELDDLEVLQTGVPPEEKFAMSVVPKESDIPF